MNKFRASFSTLSVWASGDWQRAINAYFKIDQFSTPAMEAGKKLHEQWDQEIKKTGYLPKVFGTKKLGDGTQTELKIVKQLDEWLELVGVIDCYDPIEKVIYDWKSGKTDSESYAGSFQPLVYQILIPTAQRAEIHHFDQYANKTDMSIIHLSETSLERGVDWVLTHASEMHGYLVDNNLYEKLSNLKMED